jgi:uncharacterized C2H2 Zn-finger protein
MATEKTKKNTHYYECTYCDYVTCKKTDFKRHIITQKHNFNISSTTINGKNEKIYICNICEKIFKERSGLWRHKKKCTEDNNLILWDEDGKIKDKDELVLQLLKQNVDLQKSLIEISKEKTITNNTNNNFNNTTNNSFNLNLFLNDTCKDAMNISDFVSSINFNLDDLENTGRQGYIQGITHIILKNLNKLEQCFRPLHCSDLKREVLYIKDNNEWIKETCDKPILTKAIKIIANENIKQIKHWRDKNPDCTDYNSKKNNLYLKIVSNSMNGSTEEEGNKNINKIISNVVKEVTIDKT